MAFTLFGKRWGGATGKVGPGQTGEATEVWEFHADNIDETSESLRQSGLLPSPYVDRHALNPQLVAMVPDITQDEEHPARFIVTLKWSSEPLSPKEIEKQTTNPLNRKAKIRIRTVREKEISHTDRLGKLKANTAGDLFDPPIESNRSYLQIEITKNVTIFPDWVFEFIDAVNSTDFDIKGRTILAERACIEEIELGEELTEGDFTFCVARVLISVKKPREVRRNIAGNSVELAQDGTPVEYVPGPWQTEQLNEGLHALVAGVRTRIQVNDESSPPKKENAANPVLLDYTGDVINITSPSQAVQQAFYVVFDDHDYMDFNLISYLWSDS